MAFDVLNVGTTVNDGTGDTLRAGGQKINANFAKAVEGPGTVTADRMAVFDSTTGKLIKQAAFTEADVARLSETQTFTGTKTFTQTVTGGKFAPTANTVTGNGMYLPTTNTVAFSTNGSERMRIGSSGDVGIGTTSPEFRLQVNGGVAVDNERRLIIQNAASGVAGFFANRQVNSGRMGFELYAGFGGSYNGAGFTTGDGRQFIISGSDTASESEVRFATGSGRVERMRITSAGNVGIGTATPSTTLDVGGTGALKTPVGTDGQRPTPATGMLRFNTDSGGFEGYDGSAWGAIGGGGGVAVDDAQNILATQVFG
jgi:hypothetical protein